ncbi:hypothetical protein BDB00DRAFT_77154 [Zychaea mexicana]|uniref:uncharacterized protein n=1 Tax=Zychaea mexicana TaxID=64656 RepID=UPI0022FEAAAF|nr:uncharacterized protein BDB00DRAFT_77154 [Zychaea mexicana]KAI9496869.1 hypothetical protein BDB00DRAFT_77154 [Zychaea mexicana]
MSGEERNEQHANTDEQVPSSGENATFQAVANATDNIQSAFTTLLSGFQQKLQMTQSTIDLLEQVLKNSVQIATQLEPNEQGIQLTVTIINTIQMPVPDVQCCVTFDSDQVHWSHLSTTQESLSNNNNIKGGRNHEEATSIFDATEAMLPPLCKHVEVLQIITDRTIQCNAEIRLHFPGPVPETTIPIEHTFGIYIIDQVKVPLCILPAKLVKLSRFVFY